MAITSKQGILDSFHCGWCVCLTALNYLLDVNFTSVAVTVNAGAGECASL